MRDHANNITPVVAIAAATYSADTTPVVIDLQGYDAATVLYHIGAGGITFTGTNKIEFPLQHSDDGTTFTAVAQSDVTGGVTVATGGIVKSLVSAKASADVTKVGYVGGKRYIQTYADFSGTHGTGTPIAVEVIKGRPSLSPAA